MKPTGRSSRLELFVLGLLACVACASCSGSECVAADGACVGSTADAGVATADAALEAGASCASSSDCARGLACGYAIADACRATGVCVRFTAGLSCVLAPVCSCSGVTLNNRGCGLAEGFAIEPIAHDGGC